MTKAHTNFKTLRMGNLLTVQDLKEIEARLNLLASISDSSEDCFHAEVEIDHLISILTSAHIKARINEIGLSLVS